MLPLLLCLQSPRRPLHLPVIYLPGVSRQDLRAVETCPDHLKPIVELQYRGVIWSQINARGLDHSGVS